MSDYQLPHVLFFHKGRLVSSGVRDIISSTAVIKQIYMVNSVNTYPIAIGLNGLTDLVKDIETARCYKLLTRQKDEKSEGF